mmetsp:Transcript_3397/g.7959  ORF Transcript_3397/g.7959 Transcript_3397/m.7959 type:complete len:507 (+) Transcript_3397:268-1788(+)
MFCAISGTTPEEPVISARTGHLFERSLITKALQETGECPVTKTPLTLDDLLPIKANKAVKPKPAASTSIPGMLASFHNEWDALMLETNDLRKDLHATRQELSHALYQHDAACRVVARLIKERDEARTHLASAQATGAMPVVAVGSKRGAAAANAAVAVDAGGKRAKGGVPKEVVDAMVEKSKELLKYRKKREISESLATPEAVAALGCKTTAPVHKTSAHGIAAIAVHPADTTMVATAGADGSIALFNAAKGMRASLLTGHGKKVTGIAWVGGADADALLSCSADKTVKLWAGTKCVATMDGVHKGEVAAVTVHPTAAYAASISADKSWAFYDIGAAECLSMVNDEACGAGGFTCGSFHPDGLILATGCADSVVKVWDVKSQNCVAKVEGHSGPVHSLSFSENGYYLATCAADGVKLWDLRKLKNFKSIAPYSEGAKAAATSAVAFDFSGHYLAVGGGDARVYNVKADWELVKAWEVAKPVTSVAFAPDAAGLYVGAADHNLRVFA